MPVLTEMDIGGSGEPLPKRPGMKNSLITKFFKSPNRTETEKEPAKPCATEIHVDDPAETENNLDSSLCDFDVSAEQASTKKPNKCKSKDSVDKPKPARKSKGRTKKSQKEERKEEEKSKAKEEAEPIPMEATLKTLKKITYEEFLKLGCSGGCTSESADPEKETNDASQEDQTISIATEDTNEDESEKSAKTESENDQVISKDMKKDEFAKTESENDKSDFGATECELYTARDGENNQDESVLIVDDGCDSPKEKTPEKETNATVVSVKEETEPQPKKKTSYFTIFESRQLQGQTGKKSPVVITVNVPDSPSTTPSKLASIFDKSKARTGLEKDESNSAELSESDEKPKRPAKSTGKKSRAKLKMELDKTTESKDKTLEKVDYVDGVAKIGDDSCDGVSGQKSVAEKMAGLDKRVVKVSKRNTQSKLQLSDNGLKTERCVKSSSPDVPTHEENAPKSKTTSKGTKSRSKADVKSKAKQQKKTPKKQTKKSNETNAEILDVTPSKPKQQRKTPKKQTKKSNETNAEILDVTPSKPKQQRKTPKKQTKKSSETNSRTLDVTPVNKKRKRANSIPGAQSDNDIEIVETCSGKKRKKGSDSVYSSEIVESPVSMKKAPIKIRLTRMTKTASDKAGASIAKVSKAQELVQKAKGGKRKTGTSPKTAKTKPAAKKKPSLRRSSRQCSKLAAEAIKHFSPAEKTTATDKDTDSAVNEKDANASAKDKGVKKNSEKCPKPAKKGKLAPIFAKKDDEPVIVVSEESTKPKVPVDPEKLRAQRDFLMSGAPEQLKKARALASACSAEYPPFPAVGQDHVRQESVSLSERQLNPWNLAQPILSCRFRDVGVSVRPEILGSVGSVSPCDTSLTTKRIKDTKSTELFSEDAVKYLLGEIHLYNPNFPVRRTYNQLRKKLQQADRLGAKTQAGDFDTANGEKRSKEDKNSTRKRKLQDANDGDKNSERQRSKRRKGAVQNNDCDDVEEKSSRKRNVIVVNEVESSKPLEETTDAQTPDSGVLWTDKYQPVCAADVMGNSKQVKKLWTWLNDWKEKTNKEIKRLKKQLKKDARKGKITKEEAKKRLGGDFWSDDDSDFDLDSCSDSDFSDYEEDDGLCNTMLLVGPHGVGKTSTVSAVATELGYKVFEVNASSKRAGKHIIAQLQEATQSHQVSKENLDAVYTTFAALSKKFDGKAEVAEKKMPAAFSNFFKKNDQGASKVSESKEDSSKKKDTSSKNVKEVASKKSAYKKEITTVASPPAVKGLNLSSTSLILFEEADVVFEEDKGFWAAVQSFINTTKRPIVLTTSDPGISDLVDGRHEITTLKLPPSESIASYLQVMCLAERLRTDHFDMLSVVKFCGGDIRKCVNAVQFWADSGGGSTQVERPVNYSATFLKNPSDESQKCSSEPGPQTSTPNKIKAAWLQLNTSVDSEEEFISLPPRNRKKRAMIESDDESSRDDAASVTGKTEKAKEAEADVQSSQESATHQIAEICKGDTLTAEINAPLLHRNCLDSTILCKSHTNSALNSLKSLADPAECTSGLPLRRCLQELGTDTVYNHLPFLLHIPRTQQRNKPAAPDPSKGFHPKVLRRIVNPTSDLFDSDGSEDEDSAKDAKPEETASASVEGPGQQPKREKDPSAKVMIKSLTALSEMYDTFSFSDAYLSEPCGFRERLCSRHAEENWKSGRQTSGISDTVCYDDEKNYQKRCFPEEALTIVNIQNVSRANAQLRECLDSAAKLTPSTLAESATSSLTIPGMNSLDYVRSDDETDPQFSERSGRNGAISYVADCLPEHVYGDGLSLAVDYLPTVRLICRTEQLKRAACLKRRFLHYFDSISLGVTRKQSVMDVLCSSLT